MSGYMYCAHCCLVALSNDVTRKAIQRGCPEKAIKDREEKARKKRAK